MKTLKLSSGLEIDANRDIIGISGALEVGLGYDEMFRPEDENYRERPLTAAERAELADHMIALWQRFKANGPVSP